MKKILVLLILSTTCAFSQYNSQFKTLQLENSIKIAADQQAPPQNITYFAQDNSRKSPGIAILLSMLLPGMGELYADNYSSGKYFTVAEGTLWGVYIGMNSYGNWLKDRYKSFAVASGGVNSQGKNADYYATIGNYLNIDEYNNSQALNQNFSQMFNTSKYYWNWQSPNDRKAYRNMWVSSEQAHNDLRFVVGALILNRIASAINAVRLVSAYNKRVSEQMSWNVSVGVVNSNTLPSSLNFNFETSF
jgi:hypothetical protein